MRSPFDRYSRAMMKAMQYQAAPYPGEKLSINFSPSFMLTQRKNAAMMAGKNTVTKVFTIMETIRLNG